MGGELRARVSAAAAVGRSLKSSSARALLSANGYRPGVQIVAVLPGDTVAEVLARVVEHQPPVILAVYYGTTDQVTFAQVAPGAAAGDTRGVSGAATMGTLLELLGTEGSLDLHVTDWSSYSVRALVAA